MMILTSAIVFVSSALTVNFSPLRVFTATSCIAIDFYFLLKQGSRYLFVYCCVGWEALLYSSVDYWDGSEWSVCRVCCRMKKIPPFAFRRTSSEAGRVHQHNRYQIVTDSSGIWVFCECLQCVFPAVASILMLLQFEILPSWSRK
jgi:hypothetical protein